MKTARPDRQTPVARFYRNCRLSGRRAMMMTNTRQSKPRQPPNLPSPAMQKVESQRQQRHAGVARNGASPATTTSFVESNECASHIKRVNRTGSRMCLEDHDGWVLSMLKLDHEMRIPVLTRDGIRSEWNRKSRKARERCSCVVSRFDELRNHELKWIVGRPQATSATQSESRSRRASGEVMAPADGDREISAAAARSRRASPSISIPFTSSASPSATDRSSSRDGSRTAASATWIRRSCSTGRASNSSRRRSASTA